MTTKPAGSLFQPSDNVAKMQASSTLSAMQAAEALRAAGENVVDFGAGEPDFDTPDNIKSAAAEAMRAGKTKYTATGGARELQQSIIDFYASSFGANYERNEVMATSGGKQAIFNAVVSLINPGDEVLMAKPYWVTFPEVVVFARGVPVFIETEETGFVLSAEQVERAITPRTKLIILNSPCNPSGRVIPRRSLRESWNCWLGAASTSFPTNATCASFIRRGSFQCGEFAGGTPRPSLYRRVVFKNIRDDWLARRLRAGAAGMDPRNVEGARPLDEQC